MTAVVLQRSGFDVYRRYSQFREWCTFTTAKSCLTVTYVRRTVSSTAAGCSRSPTTAFTVSRTTTARPAPGTRTTSTAKVGRIQEFRQIFLADLPIVINPVSSCMCKCVCVSVCVCSVCILLRKHMLQGNWFFWKIHLYRIKHFQSNSATHIFLLLHFQDQTLAFYLICEYVVNGEKFNRQRLPSDGKSGICHRVAPPLMLYVMTLTYIFKVTNFEMWIFRKRRELAKNSQV